MIAISVLIIAICSVIFLLIGFIIAISILRLTKRLNQTISLLNLQLQPFIFEMNKTMTKTNEIVSKIKGTIDQAEPMIASVVKAGRLMEHCVNKMQRDIECSNPSFCSHEYKKIHKSENWLEWVDLGIILWQKIRRGIEK